MPRDPVASRYAQAIFETAKAEGQVEEVGEQLALIGGLLRDHPDLRQLMRNPDVDPEDKIGILERTLKGSWSKLVRAAIEMTVAMGRASSIPEMTEAFQDFMDEDQGRLRVVVRSAYPLSETVLHRVRAMLERRERKQIEVASEVDRELLGGLQVRLDHRLIDGSIQRQLAELRQQLLSARVS
jgi:F-type H+-transporting ATPase subunit delta